MSSKRVYKYTPTLSHLLYSGLDIIILYKNKKDTFYSKHMFEHIVKNVEKYSSQQLILDTSKDRILLTNGCVISFAKWDIPLKKRKPYITMMLHNFNELLEPEVKKYGLEWLAEFWGKDANK